MSMQPDPPLDPVEALVHIRTLVKATADLTYGTRAEPTIREVMKILEKAPTASSRAADETQQRVGWTA